MAGLYSAFGSDKGRERDGAWVDIGPARFKLARAGGANVVFGRAVMQATKPYRRFLEKGDMDPEVADRIMVKVYAETIVLDWEGVDGADGQPVPYSREACVKLLTDLPNLFQEIQREAAAYHTFAQEGLEKSAGN